MNPRNLLASWFAPLLIHNQNQSMAAIRAADAKAKGLDPTMFGTVFPGSNVTTTTTNNAAGYLKGAAAALITAATGGAAALGLAGHSKPPQPQTPVATKATTEIHRPHFAAIYEEQGPDGTWHPVKVLDPETGKPVPNPELQKP